MKTVYAMLLPAQLSIDERKQTWDVMTSPFLFFSFIRKQPEDFSLPASLPVKNSHGNHITVR